MSLYKQIFLEAFAVTRRHKILWIFGFFAILFSGSVEADLYYNFLSNQRANVYDLAQSISTNVFNKNTLMSLPANLLHGAQSDGSPYFTFFLVFLAIIFILLVSISSELLVINQAAALIKTPKLPTLSFSELILGTLKNLRPSIAKATLVNILLKVFVFLTFLLIASPILASSGIPNVIADFSYLLLFVVLTPFIILTSLYARYLVINLTLTKNTLSQAASESWSVLKKNWLLSMEVSFALFIFSIASVFITLVLISGLSIALWFFALLTQGLSYQAYVIAIAFSYLILFLVFLFCNALVSTFSISVWTSLYLKLTKNSQNEPLVGFIGNISK